MDQSEKKIQADIIKMLQRYGWYVKQTHGNAYQDGFPDLYATHPDYPPKWIEVKKPVGYRFTDAQLKTFTQWAGRNVGVWVLIAATEEEYKKLFLLPNWHCYLKF